MKVVLASDQTIKYSIASVMQRYRSHEIYWEKSFFPKLVENLRRERDHLKG